MHPAGKRRALQASQGLPLGLLSQKGWKVARNDRLKGRFLGNPGAQGGDVRMFQF
jgi:hypothetical protein